MLKINRNKFEEKSSSVWIVIFNAIIFLAVGFIIGVTVCPTPQPFPCSRALDANERC